MTRVGFEPTHPKISGPKPDALDHSAISPQAKYLDCLFEGENLKLRRCFRNKITLLFVALCQAHARLELAEVVSKRHMCDVMELLLELRTLCRRARTSYRENKTKETLHYYWSWCCTVW